MIEQPHLTLVRFFDAERYVLRRADGQEFRKSVGCVTVWAAY
jgi:hypothetical protein